MADISKFIFLYDNFRTFLLKSRRNCLIDKKPALIQITFGPNRWSGIPDKIKAKDVPISFRSFIDDSAALLTSCQPHFWTICPFNEPSCGFETLRHLMIERLVGCWNGSEQRIPEPFFTMRQGVLLYENSKLRGWELKWSYRSEIRQVPRQQYCRGTCQISERSENIQISQHRDFEKPYDNTLYSELDTWNSPGHSCWENTGIPGVW